MTLSDPGQPEQLVFSNDNGTLDEVKQFVREALPIFDMLAEEINGFRQIRESL